MRLITVMAAVLMLASAARAEERALTVGECMMVARGLRALDWAGATLDQGQQPPGAKQYKLGALRGRIGLNLAALQRVVEGVDKARTGLMMENFGSLEMKPGPEQVKFLADLQKVIDGKCDVRPVHIKLADLRLGDGADENQIPGSVIAALAPIIDGE